MRGVMAPWDGWWWAGNWKEKPPGPRSRRSAPRSHSAAWREGVHSRSSYRPSQTPEPVLRCLHMPRATRPPALGLYLCSSFTVSRSTSPMTSVSVSGVVSTRAANFLMRLFGAITASLIAESRPSSLPTGATSPALRRGSDWATVHVGCWPWKYLRTSSSLGSAKLTGRRALHRASGHFQGHLDLGLPWNGSLCVRFSTGQSRGRGVDKISEDGPRALLRVSAEDKVRPLIP